MQVVIETVPTQELGDDWLEQLLVERYPDLLRLAYLILHDHSEAEDVTQLALERAWRSRTQVRSADSTLYWLRRIVVREALRARSSPWCQGTAGSERWRPRELHNCGQEN